MITTLPDVPEVVTNLQSSNIMQTSFVASWNAPTSGRSVSVYRIEVLHNNSVVQTQTTANTTILLSNLSDSTSYIFRVRGENSGGAGQYVTSSMVTTLPHPPIALENLQQRTITNSRFEATWNPPASGRAAIFYRIELLENNTVVRSDTIMPLMH
jgi:hypothetical protein